MWDFLSDLIDTASGFVESLGDSVSGAVSGFIDKAEEIASPVIDAVSAFFNSVSSSAESVIGSIGQSIGNYLDALTSAPQSLYQAVSDSVSGYIDPYLQQVTDWYNSLANSISSSIGAVLGSVSVPPEPEAPGVPQVPGVPAVGGGGGGGAAPPPGAPAPALPERPAPEKQGLSSPDIIGILRIIADFMLSLPKSAIRVSFPFLPIDLISKVTEILGKEDNVQAIIDALSDIDKAKASVAFFAPTGAALGSPFGLFPIINDCYAALFQPLIRNAAMGIFRPTKLDISSLADMMRKQLISPEKAYADGAAQGYDDLDVWRAYRAGFQYLSATEILQLWRRGVMSDEECGEYLSKIGIAPDDTPRIYALTEYLPGIQDLISMAVREAFSPDVAGKFGQYEDFPEAFAEHAAKLGMSREWAERYWAAHWDLPGTADGFEMLHRGIITEDELKLLLRAKDIMPFWRDKLIQLSYTPLARVDIRRMHKIGILSDNDLIIRYKALGYSPADAEALARFTIQLNKEEEKEEKAAQRDLTGSEIVAGYKSGILSRQTALDMLRQLGYDPAEAEFKVLMIDYSRQRDVLDKRADIIQLYCAEGLIDDNEAIDKFNQLGLDMANIEYRMAEIEYARTKAGIAEAKAIAKKGGKK